VPTLLNEKGLRFFFYSNENSEPIHIHVKKGQAEGKIWLEPTMGVAWLHGFTNAEEKDIIQIVQVNLDFFKSKWNEYFNAK
jgi:hypothetical protein